MGGIKQWLVCGAISVLLSACGQESSTQASTKQQASQALGSAERTQLQQDFATTPFTVLSISELSFDNAPALAVTFSAPLDPSLNWRDYLTISLNNKSTPEGDWILGSSLNTVYFPFIEPATNYTVKVKTGVSNIAGKQLAKAQEKTLTTRNREQNVKFISYGTQLSPSLAEGLSIEAVNVQAVDIDFFRIDTEKLGHFFAQAIGNQVYQLQEIKHYGKLAYSARFDLDYAPNKRIKSVIPLISIQELQKPSVYFAVLREEGQYDYQYPTTWFTMGDIGLQVRQYATEWVAFTHHAITTEPAKAITITLYDRDGKALATEQTSTDGLAKFPASKLNSQDSPAFAIAQQGEHFSVLKLQAPAMDLSEFRLPSRAQKPLELFLYSPRDLYRPGETLVINGLLRDNDARLAGNPPINASLITPDGRVYQSLQWQGDKQAFYTHSITLPNDAVRGEWQWQAQLGNGERVNYAFNVEDFLPERMKLQLTPSGSKHLNAKSADLAVTVQGDYLYGAPAAGNRVEATVQATSARTLFEEWDGFIFGLEDYTAFNTTTELPATTLDEQGNLQLAITNEWQGTSAPLKLTTRVSLFESGGRPVSRAVSQYIWPHSALIGIRPTWDGRYANPNDTAIVELVQVDTDGKQTEAKQVEVLVLREDNQYYWEWDNGWRSSHNMEPTPIYNRVLDLPANERTPIAIPTEYGHYRVEVRDRDKTLIASYRFFAGWSWDKPGIGETGRPDKITMSWDADGYAPNSQAKLTFDAPFTGTALVTLEAEQLLWHTTLTVEAGENTVTIPVDRDWKRHDIYATVNLLRSAKVQNGNKAMPKRALGLLHLPLDRSARELQLTVNTPAKTLPETELIARVHIDNAIAESGPVHLTLSAVDSGVLSLSQFKTPDPFAWFFEPRAFDTSLRDTWASFIEQLSDTRARQRFGGDAASELARGGEAPKSDVQVVQLYSGKVTVDNNGNADIPLSLPYFNGELRLMVAAWNNNQFGQLETPMKIAAPLIAEVSTPRFLAFNDRSQATFDIQNLTDVSQTINVNVSADSLLGAGQLTEHLTLKPSQKHTLNLPITAQQSSGQGQVSIAVTQDAEHKIADQPDLTLERTWRIGLRPAYPAISISTDAVINAGDQFIAPTYDKPPFEVPQQQLFLSVSPQPPLNLAEHLQHLMQYPYGCLEQTSSRLWPLLVSSQAEMVRYIGDKASATQLKLLTDRASAINAAIGRISGMERGDGSFGLWNNQSNEEHWLSAYATDALLTAKAQGYAVDDALLNRALSNLKSYVTTQGKRWSESQRYSQWPDHYHLAYRAYSALVLAERQQVNLGDLRTLYDGYASQAKSPLPLAQLALALELAGDARRAKEAWAKALADTNWPEGYAGDYGTPVRDLAWVSTLALRSRLVDNPMAQLFALRDRLVDYRWLSTQDRWALFQLGHSLEQSALANWPLKLTADNETQSESLTQAFNKLWQGSDVPSSLVIDNPTDKPLFVSLQYSGYPTEAPKPVSDGIFVKRFFYNTQGEPLAIKQVTTGDLIVVRLDVYAEKQRIPDALIVDLLPAGFELENPNLATSVKLDDIRIDSKPISEWQQNANIVHQEFRDDRYVAALSLRRRNTSQVFYLARAVTPGNYTIPPSLVEDMYRPWLRAVGESEGTVEVLAK